MEEHKTIVKYCEDTTTFLLICTECLYAINLGRADHAPQDCKGSEWEGNGHGCRTWVKQQ